ncbi:MAG: hypothetical protein ABSE69_06505 [Roseiarcus sp.]
MSKVLVFAPDAHESESILKMNAFRAADEFVWHHFKGKCVVGDASQAEIVRVDPVTFAVDGVVQTLTWYQKVVTRKFSALLGIGEGPIIDADAVDIARNGLFVVNYFFYARALRVQRKENGDFDLVAGAPLFDATFARAQRALALEELSRAGKLLPK